MKKLIAVCTIAITTLASSAQSDAISTYFKKYESDTSFTKVSVSGKMFELFTHVEGETAEEKEVMKTISKLSGLKVLNKQNAVDSKTLYANANKTKMAGYEVLMTVQDSKDNITFYIREQSGIVKELLLIGASGQEFYIISLMGDIDLKQISKLSHALNIGGMEKLENIKAK